MVYIPFIYFTLFLLWYWFKYHTFGIGFVAIAWIDLSSIFAIWIDYRNIYGYMGVNEYSIALLPTILYCLFWTLILYPFTKLDNDKYQISINKPDVFRYLCYFLCLMVSIQLVSGDFMELLQRGINLSGAENYELANDTSNYYQGQGKFWLWIPRLISCSYPLMLLCWFVSITICPQKKWLQLTILLLSTTKMLIGFLTGGRAQFIWWIITFLLLYAFFKKYLTKQLKTRIHTIFAVLASTVFIGFFSITLSRFGDVDIAMDSLIGYGGQTFNNFCALFPHVNVTEFRSERIFPLTNIIFFHSHYSIQDYNEFISSEYPIRINVFFPFFGSFMMDAGILGVVIVLILYLYVFRHFILLHNIENTMDFSSLTIVALMTFFISQGLFHYPFSYHENTAYLIMSFLIYFAFKYNFKIKN